jgi:hypothetical protein
MPAEYAIVELALPGRPAETVGVLLRRFDRLDFRLREDWEHIAQDSEDLEVLTLLPEAFRERIDDSGAEEFLRWATRTWSNVIRISDLREQKGRSSLGELFRDHVERPYPFFASLKAAAHEFDEEWGDAQSAGAEWFVAPVVGRSMEPDIPDGSRCLFRRTRGGSHQNKIVLIQRAGSLPESAKYTVKRYRSEKIVKDGSWEHARAVGIPLNPEFETFDLREGDKIIAEFVRVID